MARMCSSELNAVRVELGRVGSENLDPRATLVCPTYFMAYAQTKALY